MAQTRQRYVFLVDWVDVPSRLVWQFNLFCYDDDTVELWDLINRKLFLKRVRLPGIVRSDVYIGKRLPVYSRTMTVVDYGDDYTRTELESVFERTFALIKPDAYDHIGEILQYILDKGFKVTKMKMVRMDVEQFKEFYQRLSGHPSMRFLVALMLSGPMLAMEIQAPHACCKWLELMGPEDPEVARAENPDTLRALYGENEVSNAVHGSATLADYQRELNIFFDVGTMPPEHGVAATSAELKDSALCIIKPHSVFEGIWPRIIMDLVAKKFTISAMQMFCLDRVNAAEYLQVYNGLMTDFPDMVEQLSWGPCIAVAVVGFGTDTVARLLAACGPAIPLLGRQLYPDTIRAKFGKTLLLNAVHCTDLPQDGASDVRYFFHHLRDKFV